MVLFQLIYYLHKKIKRMNNNNLNNLKTNLCTKQIDFLSNVSKEIKLDKKGKNLYFRMFGLEINRLSNFIYGIPENKAAGVNLYNSLLLYVIFIQINP